MIIVLVATVLIAPSAQASSTSTGASTITTAPGLLAELNKADITLAVERPATSRLLGQSPRAANAAAAIRFPLRDVVGRGEYAFTGGLIIRNQRNGREVTLQDITVDVPGRKVFVRIRQALGMRIEAFTITNPGATTSTVRRSRAGRERVTTLKGATLAVSPVVGNRLNEFLGLTGSDALFSPGLVLGTADMRIVTKL